MKRAETLEVLRAALAQLDVLAHDADDVSLLLNGMRKIPGIGHRLTMVVEVTKRYRSSRKVLLRNCGKIVSNRHCLLKTGTQWLNCPRDAALRAHFASTNKSSLEPVGIAQIVVAPTIADSPRSGRNSLAQRATLGSGTHNRSSP